MANEPHSNEPTPGPTPDGDGPVAAPESAGPEPAPEAAKGEDAGNAGAAAPSGRKRSRGPRGRSREPGQDPKPSSGAGGEARGPKGKGRARGKGGDRPHGGKRGPNKGRRDERRPDRREDTGLTAALFQHIEEKEVPCRVAGCENTWTWYARDQLLHIGQPPPKRMCRSCLGENEAVAEKELPCRRASCENTWTWKRGEQLAQLERFGKLKAPSRLCNSCRTEEQTLEDRPVPCRVPGCDHTWVWSRDAQQKHRAWVDRALAEQAQKAEPDPSADAEAPAESGSSDAPASAGKKRRRRRRGKGRGPSTKIDTGPPARLCDGCREELGRIQVRTTVCKVHGCTNDVAVEKEAVLRAWVKAGRMAEFGLPRRMCNSCRDFCKANPDREVDCGKPECSETWTYKTGAALQDQLAGRTATPLRLANKCAECRKGWGIVPGSGPGAVAVETMPCVVAGCAGTWGYVAGMDLGSGDQPPERMCNDCREQRGHAPRNTQTSAETTGPAATEDGGVEAAPADSSEPVANSSSDASDDEATPEGNSSDDNTPAARETTRASASFAVDHIPVPDTSGDVASSSTDMSDASAPSSEADSVDGATDDRSARHDVGNESEAKIDSDPDASETKKDDTLS